MFTKMLIITACISGFDCNVRRRVGGRRKGDRGTLRSTEMKIGFIHPSSFIPPPSPCPPAPTCQMRDELFIIEDSNFSRKPERNRHATSRHKDAL